jgi:hypothetical protein
MLFATGLMTRRHMSLEECLSHISRVALSFATVSNDPRHKVKGLPVNREPFAEFYRPGLFSLGPSGLRNRWRRVSRQKRG